MNRRFLILAAFAIASHWAAAFAQTIDVPPLTPLGQPIVAKVELPEGGKVVWKADAGSSVINASKGRAYVWAAPGGHQLQAVVAPGGDAELLWLEATYAVGDAPPTPPVVVKTLAELAGDKAAILAELLTDLREAALPIAPTTDALKNGLKAGLARAAVPVDHPAAVEIVKRLDACGSGKIDDALRKSLDAALAKAVADLGAKPPVPPTPPVVEGKRTLYIVRETANIDPDLARVVEDIQAGRTAEAQYLASKGHRVTLVDPDDVDPTGQPTPAVAKLTPALVGLTLPVAIVVDQSSGAILSKQSVNADTVTAAQLVDFVKANGG